MLEPLAGWQPVMSWCQRKRIRKSEVLGAGAFDFVFMALALFVILSLSSLSSLLPWSPKLVGNQ